MGCLENMSSIIVSIESCLHHGGVAVTVFETLRIGLRSMKALLLCVKNLGYDADLDSLLLRIQDCTRRVLDPASTPWLVEPEVHFLGKELDDLYRSKSNLGLSSCLTADQVVGIAGCILENTVDFLERMSSSYNRLLEVEVMDGLEVQVAFCRDVLILAMQTGVHQGELENLLKNVEPFAIMAARVFINHRAPIPAEVVNDYGHLDQLATFDNRRCWYVSILSAVSRMNPHRDFDPLLYQTYTQALNSSKNLFGRYQNLDDDTLENFLNSLVSLFWDMLRLDVCHLVQDKDHMQKLYEGLRFCRSLLKQQPRLFGKNIWDRIGGFICDAGVFICSFHQANVKMDDELSVLLESFHAIQVEVTNKPSQPSVSLVMKTNLLSISHGDEKDNIEQIETERWSHELLPRNTTTIKDGVIGLDEDITSIIGRLVCGNKPLRVVAICGMAGIGKTTLASKVFNHPVVNRHFHIRGWCTVSQVLDKKKVCVDLLKQINGSDDDNNSEKTEDELADLVRRSLKGRKYLIVLDDVWTTEAWESLKMSFQDDSTNSRIILTSRQYGIAPHGLLDQKPYSLRLRQDEESLEIMHMRLFHGKGWPFELRDLGMQIAEKCKGLPLTVVVVTGLLAATEQQYWKGILDAISIGGVSSEEQCNIALELSYKHLTRELKHCLLYIAAFPEDDEVLVSRLLRLWIAENFVKNIGSKRMEDVAREYLQNLIQRSLVTATKIRSIGGVKTCQIHDLLHDFCIRKAKEESFYHLLQGNDQISDFTEPCNLQRLCICSEPIHLKKSRLFCPRAHSMLVFSTAQSGMGFYPFHMSFIIQIFKLLKVLEIGQTLIASGLPSEIELLTLLRYLSFKANVGILPSSLGNLSNLETFIASFLDSEISLPHTFWNLRRMKYLSIRFTFKYGSCCVLPFEGVENSELETLGVVGYYFDGSMEKRMRKFANLCRLECMIKSVANCDPETTEGIKQIVVLDFLTQLESLTITGNSSFGVQFVLPECLRKLTLSGYFWLSRREISVIGKLPQLEVLKLRYILFDWHTLEMEEEFSALRYLKLSNLRIYSWTASDEALPSLRKLILQGCENLEKIPSCLETSSTIEEVSVSRCPSVLESIQRIEEMQKDYGYSVVVRIMD